MSEQDGLERSKVDHAMIELAVQGQSMGLDIQKRNSRMIRKLDFYIAPVTMLLMLISYLDRGNIGFAATQGMTEDIGLKGTQLNVRSPRVLTRIFKLILNRLLSRYSISSMFWLKWAFPSMLFICANSSN